MADSIDYEGVMEGAEKLCAEVLRFAYNDLLDAMLAEASHRFRKYSYNCAVYYDQLRHNRKHGRYGGDRDSWQLAKADMDRMMRWFNKSKRCETFCKTVAGSWFVAQAKRHVMAFALDEKAEWQIRPTFGIIESPYDLREEQRKVEAWKKKRDEWRDKHGMGKVDE